MKKFVVALVLVAGLAAVAYASLNHSRKKTATEKKTEKKTRECRHSCPFS